MGVKDGSLKDVSGNMGVKKVGVKQWEFKDR